MPKQDKLNNISSIDQLSDQADPRQAGQADEARGVHLRTVTILFTAVAFILAVLLLIEDGRVNAGYQQIQAANNRSFRAENAAGDLSVASDYLTSRVHYFVTTGDRRYLDEFLTEVQQTKRRETAVATLHELLGSSGDQAYAFLSRAQEVSNRLVDDEYLAMRLVLEADGTPEAEIPEALLSVSLSDELRGLSPQEKRAKASELVYGRPYLDAKREIQDNIAACVTSLGEQAQAEVEACDRRMNRMLTTQTVLTIVMLFAVLMMSVLISVLVRKPLTQMVRLMKEKKMIPPSGAEELRFVSRTYNRIFEETQKTTERLTYEAMHDGLTGLYNRKAFELLCQDADLDHAALMFIDVDKFKQINDTYGHDGGDRVLKRVARLLQTSFRSVDQIYRIGGDEFVVIMTRVNSSMRDLVVEKINRANELLQHPEGDIPPASLSVGAAFADRENPTGDLFKDADIALYRVKQTGRCGCAVY